MEQERKAAECVEWLAALWELTEKGESRSANPHLMTLLRFTPQVGAHPALDLVARLRRTQSRDRLIKAVVGAAYGEANDCRELYESLQDLATQSEKLLGAGPHQLIQRARAEALQRITDLAGELDPAADLAEITGEKLPLRVVVIPSIFLPQPQAGRHGVVIERSGEWVVHLCFGVPLRRAPQQFDINRPWLLGGAWHYAIHLYLEGLWPPVARRLAASRELAEAVSHAMGSPLNGEGTRWTDILREHVNVAFKCLLSRRLGLPDGLHRAFARAQGLVLFPWFEEWLQDSGGEGAALAAHISRLPEALAAARPRWEGIARAAAGPPPAVNLALISPSARSACLVVPDEWSEEAATAAVAGWRLWPLPLVRYEEWVRTRTGGAGAVIAFGEPERNPLVRRVLEQRGLTLAAGGAADPAIIALSSPGFEEAGWCLAVAVTRPEAAAALRIEMALDQTSSYVIFDRGVLVSADRVALDQLSPTER
ncbi:MAG: hypothetical protein WAM82_11555 [Thermoanaerobaculia bacterium]